MVQARAGGELGEELRATDGAGVNVENGAQERGGVAVEAACDVGADDGGRGAVVDDPDDRRTDVQRFVGHAAAYAARGGAVPSEGIGCVAGGVACGGADSK